MSYPAFTIKSATLTTNSTTKYHFYNDICYHIAIQDRFAVIKWYKCGDYHMFFALAFYPTDDMSPPLTSEEFFYGMEHQHTMYYFETEHLHVAKLQLTKEDNNVICIGIPIEPNTFDWKVNEVDDCLGIYRLDGDIFHHAYDSYQEAYENGLTNWESSKMGILEKS